MAVPNRKHAETQRDARSLEFGELATPAGDAPPHELQRLLIEQLGATSGVVFPREPSLLPVVERTVQAVSRIGGVALFLLALGSIALLFV
jgi:hypothetical protein